MPSTTTTEEHGEFDSWMYQVDRHVELTAGVSVHDLVDAPFRDIFNSGISALNAAVEILADNGWGGRP